MRVHLAACLFLASVLFHSCSDCEEPTPHETLSPIEYMPMTAGSWWAYVNIRNQAGEAPLVLNRDTLWALGDTTVNGENYMRFHGRLEGYASRTYFALRDSAFHLVRENGHVVLPYHNFTDTFNYGSDEQLGTYAFKMMVQDTAPTVVPAGTFATVDFRMEMGRGIDAQQICVDHPIGYAHSKFSEGVGFVLSSYWYSANGPCVTFSRELEAYNIA